MRVSVLVATIVVLFVIGMIVCGIIIGIHRYVNKVPPKIDPDKLAAITSGTDNVSLLQKTLELPPGYVLLHNAETGDYGYQCPNGTKVFSNGYIRSDGSGALRGFYLSGWKTEDEAVGDAMIDYTADVTSKKRSPENWKPKQIEETTTDNNPNPTDTKSRAAD